MLHIEKRCFVVNLHVLSESAYNIPSEFKHTGHIRSVNLTSVFFYLVKIAGSFPFDAVVQPEEICIVLASV